MVEMLVALAILVTIMLLAVEMIDRTNSIWTSTTSKLEQFRGAREAFDSLIANLGEATLDQYQGYQFQQSTFAASGISLTVDIPLSYGRKSDLRFLCGPGATEAQLNAGSPPCVTDSVFFTAPLGVITGSNSTEPTPGEYTNAASNSPGLPGLLNTCGYFIQWSNVDPQCPSIISSRYGNGAGNDIYRFRLMEFVEPAEQMTLYNLTTSYSATTGYPTYNPVVTGTWQKAALAASPSSIHTLANNVVALLLLSATSTTDTSGLLAPGFVYNSESQNSASPQYSQNNRLPPVVRVVLYTIDEVSAHRLANTPSVPNLYTGTTGQPLFQDPTKLYPAQDGSDPGDLSRFEQNLTQLKLSFRRFEAAVQMQPQPWSKNL
jgi:uncharacterized protein (TIGR02599 family)